MSSILFFSRRRRHTRLQGDWSSDVCSPNYEAIKNIQDLVRRQANHNIDNLNLQGADVMAKALTKEETEVLFARSEERRVGKVCRCRRRPGRDEKESVR